jgi:hypothetical protein
MLIGLIGNIIATFIGVATAEMSGLKFPWGHEDAGLRRIKRATSNSVQINSETGSNAGESCKSRNSVPFIAAGRE